MFYARLMSCLLYPNNRPIRLREQTMKIIARNFVDPSVISWFFGAKYVPRTLRISKKKENKW
jgi:hypothetical protein